MAFEPSQHRPKVYTSVAHVAYAFRIATPSPNKIKTAAQKTGWEGSVRLERSRVSTEANKSLPGLETLESGVVESERPAAWRIEEA